MNFTEFHTSELPRRIREGNGRLAASDLHGVDALGFRVGGAAYTYCPVGDSIEVREGLESAATVVGMSPEAWADFTAQWRTVASLIYSNALTFEDGEINLLFRWEAALRALHHGTPVFAPENDTLKDDDGNPVDLALAFDAREVCREPHEGAQDDEASSLTGNHTGAPATPATPVGEFLRTAGFAVIRSVFTPQEIRALREESDRVATTAEPGDRKSWWAKDSAGNKKLCRVTYANLRSQTIGSITSDPRIRRLIASFDPELTPLPDRLDGVALIIKNPDIRSGLSDLPWHVDCGMGGHAVFCPVVQVSVMLEPANEDTGTLRFLAGSHRFACRPPFPEQERDLPVVTVEGQPGDVFLHLGDTLHTAPAPAQSVAMRRSLVTSFFPPSLAELVPEGQAFNDVLFSGKDGQVESLMDMAGAD